MVEKTEIPSTAAEAVIESKEYDQTTTQVANQSALEPPDTVSSQYTQAEDSEEEQDAVINMKFDIDDKQVTVDPDTLQRKLIFASPVTHPNPSLLLFLRS